MTRRHFVVVGPGRAGRSFADALTAARWTCDGLLGRSDSAELPALATNTEIVLLTVPDDDIAAVAAAIEPGDAVVIHVSGSKRLDVLEPHLRRASVHPLMSLPDAASGAARLREGGVFAVAGDAVGPELVRALGGQAIEVDEDLRGLYHATAAIAANHLVVLCAQVERLAAEVGVPVEAYWELMATTLDNVRRSGAVSSLTGPAARGDESTLASHVHALSPDELDLYVTLARHAARLADTPLTPGWERR